MKVNIIIVAPYSPKWTNIASLRWASIAKYLSYHHKVSIITSSFPQKLSDKPPDLGNTELVEVPLLFYRRKQHLDGDGKQAGVLSKSSIFRKIKAELRVPLERFFPISSGGVLYHDIRRYYFEIEKRLDSNTFNVLITSYDPWFSLRLGKKFKKMFGQDLLWIADFRDPSFNIHESQLSKAKVFETSTKRMIEYSDMVTVVTETLQKEYKRISKSDVIFLPNGYEGELDALEARSAKAKEKNKLTIAYTGSLHPVAVDILPFLPVLRLVKENYSDIRVEFLYAGSQYKIVEEEFKKFGLDSSLQNRGFVKRQEALEFQRKSDLLLLIAYTGDNIQIGKGVRTGKVYEYLASGKPIIAVAPNSWEMREEIELDGVSKVFNKWETKEMAQYIVELAKRTDITIDTEKRRRIVEKYLYENIALELEKKILELLQEKTVK